MLSLHPVASNKASPLDHWVKGQAASEPSTPRRYVVGTLNFSNQLRLQRFRLYRDRRHAVLSASEPIPDTDHSIEVDQSWTARLVA